MNRLCLFLLFLILSIVLSGQYDEPAAGLVFDDREVPRVDIYLEPDSLDQILNGDLESFHEYPATFYYTTSYSRDTVEQVGFRLRGNTSRVSEKKSFKVAFNSFVKGQDFDGIEKMNLNGEHNDPSILRSKMCWDICKELGIPSSRANHVELYVNDSYMGLYINVEHVDKEFLKKRFEDVSGNLYKCLYPADMAYRGTDPDLYKETDNWGNQAYELKTNKEKGDYSDLAHLIDILNNFSGQDYICALEKAFDVDAYLKAIVMDVLTGNWDGPLINKNNFYLYHDPLSGRMVYLPFDLDNTLGIDWFNVDWSTADVFNWTNNTWEHRPLYDEIMKVPEYKNRYTHYFREALDQIFTEDKLDDYLNAKLELLSPYRVDDTFAGMDYGYSHDDFVRSYAEGLGAHNPHGLKEFVSRRYASANTQVEAIDIIPVIRNIVINLTDDQVEFTIEVYDDEPIDDILFNYQLDGNGWEQVTLTVDAEGKAALSIKYADEKELHYYASVIYGVGIPRSYPFCKDGLLQLEYDKPKLVINELLASNSQIKADNYGEYDDWVELYNAGSQKLELDNYYLTDDALIKDKWQLPYVNLFPGQYYTVWLDNDTKQGDDHANFKLSKSGEYLALYTNLSTYSRVIDSLSFPPQIEDITYARQPNGTGEFVFADYHTFGYNNNNLSSTSSLEARPHIRLFPNPTSDHLDIEGLENDGIRDGAQWQATIYDASGQLMYSQTISHRINTESLSAGQYYLKLQKGQVDIIKDFIIIR